jgi:hypothetical protein|tara:strand:- start:1474 stop:2379 length:906 start_codon:yes stop_codon:yes gene_type:complete
MLSTQDKTYAQLKAQVIAKLGASALTSDEDTMLLSLVNARAYEAYQSSQNWPRYLVVAEPRTIIADQTIQRSEDSFYVYGAGNDDTNGLYLRNGTVNSIAAYTKYDTDGTTALFSLVSETAGNDAFLVAGAPATSNTRHYSADLVGSSNNEYPTQFTVVETAGTAPAPFLVDVANINEFMRVHRNRSFLNNSSLEYDFYVTSKGAHILNPFPTDSSLAYVTYKKEFTEFATSSSDIPKEFYFFIAGAVHADFLRMRNMFEEAQTEEALANNYLAVELEKINTMNNTNLITRFSTHLSRQSR